MPATSVVAHTRFIRQDVQSMHGYAIQDATGMVKLDAMENPFRLPPRLQAKLGARLGAVAINRYPTTCVADVVRELSAFVGLPEGCALTLGNGSDELITMLSMLVDTPLANGRPPVVLAPVPGFVMYEMSAKLQGLRFVGVPLRADDFELDGPAMLAAIAEHQPAITYLAYPNNPTANLWDDAVIEQIIAAAAAYGGLVVMDEAYQPFASRTWLTRLQPGTPEGASTSGNVLVMRTLSKFGLAGVRLGYLVGPCALVAEVDKVRPPYNVSVLNAEATLFALEHADVFAEQAAVLREQRASLLAELAKLNSVTPFPSEANMILVRVPDSAKAFAGMKARGVLVKHIAGLHPMLANCLRLTVGTPDENTLMLAALAASV